MYFTRNNYKDGKIGKNENDIICGTGIWRINDSL
jgi:hypothetical protein